MTRVARQRQEILYPYGSTTAWTLSIGSCTKVSAAVRATLRAAASPDHPASPAPRQAPLWPVAAPELWGDLLVGIVDASRKGESPSSIPPRNAYLNTVEHYGHLLHRTGFAGCRTVAGKMEGPNPLCHAHASNAPQRAQTCDTIGVQESAHGDFAVTRRWVSGFKTRPEQFRVAR